jgi:hypothetical protein
MNFKVRKNFKIEHSPAANSFAGYEARSEVKDKPDCLGVKNGII